MYTDDIIVLDWLVENVEWPDDLRVEEVTMNSDHEVRFLGVDGIDCLRYGFYPERVPGVVSIACATSGNFTKEQFMEAKQRRLANTAKAGKIPEPEFGQVFHLDGGAVVYTFKDHGGDYIFRDAEDGCHSLKHLTELDEYKSHGLRERIESLLNEFTGTVDQLVDAIVKIVEEDCNELKRNEND